MAIIPDHVTGGDDFLCEVRGVKFLVTTPPGALPGQRIHVIVPRQLQTANNSSDKEYEDDSTGEVWEEAKVDRNDLFEDDDDRNRVMSMTEVEKDAEIFRRLDSHRHKSPENSAQLSHLSQMSSTWAENQSTSYPVRQQQEDLPGNSNLNLPPLEDPLSSIGPRALKEKRTKKIH
jgi:hypothetical protein